jgi:hypothetical protein
MSTILLAGGQLPKFEFEKKILRNNVVLFVVNEGLSLRGLDINAV